MSSKVPQTHQEFLHHVQERQNYHYQIFRCRSGIKSYQSDLNNWLYFHD